MMTKKHFELIATILKNLPTSNTAEEKYRARVAVSFAKNLASITPRFNVDRFLCACDVAVCGECTND